MRTGFIGAFIGIVLLMGALGGIAWNAYTSPKSIAVETSGLKHMISIERESVSSDFNSRFRD